MGRYGALVLTANLVVGGLAVNRAEASSPEDTTLREDLREAHFRVVCTDAAEGRVRATLTTRINNKGEAGAWSNDNKWPVDVELNNSGKVVVHGADDLNVNLAPLIEKATPLLRRVDKAGYCRPKAPEKKI